MRDAEHYLLRWQKAGLLDEATAASIRIYETSQAKPTGRQWQVLLALILGALLLGAGVLLFVAAHWDEVSPISRLLLVLFMLVFFHGLGVLFRERFDGLSTALHAVGTIASGAAVALVGQIFNMQEHWPAAVLLWALCAAAGWYLLRDQFQETLALLLVPAWLISEFIERTKHFSGAQTFTARIIAVIAAAFLVSFLRSQRRAVFGILFTAGAIALAISTGILSEGWPSRYVAAAFIPMSYRIIAFALMAAACVFAWLRGHSDAVPAAVVAIGAIILPWLHNTVTTTEFGTPWTRSEPNIFFYVLVAAIAISFVAWGVHRSSIALVNFGMIAFAVTVFWFYFSSVMDKLGRSLGLMLLGVLFLAGGWVLEQTRRRLVSSIAGGHE
jgi:uncharacterized membrane protein